MFMNINIRSPAGRKNLQIYNKINEVIYMENVVEDTLKKEELMNFEEMVNKIHDMEKDEEKTIFLSSQRFDRCATFNA